MADIGDADFRRQLVSIGVLHYSEQDTLLSIAKRCAVTTGLAMGVALGARTLNPEVFLAGVLAGTFVCTAANLSMREQIKALVDN